MQFYTIRTNVKNTLAGSESHWADHDRASQVATELRLATAQFSTGWTTTVTTHELNADLYIILRENKLSGDTDAIGFVTSLNAANKYIKTRENDEFFIYTIQALNQII